MNYAARCWLSSDVTGDSKKAGEKREKGIFFFLFFFFFTLFPAIYLNMSNPGQRRRGAGANGQRWHGNHASEALMVPYGGSR